MLPRRKKLLPEELGWVAGYLEGEGCFQLAKSHERKDGSIYRIPIVNVGCTDLDALLKLQAYTGLGVVRGPYTDPKHPNWKPKYTWRVSRNRDAVYLMELVLPYMCTRRAQQINDVLNEYFDDRNALLQKQRHPYTRQRRNFCVHGHRMTPKNTYVWGNSYKVCKKCRTIAKRKSDMKKRGN
jgi:hypothetical protein